MYCCLLFVMALLLRERKKRKYASVRVIILIFLVADMIELEVGLTFVACLILVHVFLYWHEGSWSINVSTQAQNF